MNIKRHVVALFFDGNSPNRLNKIIKVYRYELRSIVLYQPYDTTDATMSRVNQDATSSFKIIFYFTSKSHLRRYVNTHVILYFYKFSEKQNLIDLI